jgi:hypothetical protein
LTAERDSAIAESASADAHLASAKENSDAIKDELNAALAEIATLTADFDAKVQVKADELAEAKAASIAASAGTDPATISDDSAASEAEQDAAFSGMSQLQLWEHFAKIKESDGDDAARAFYIKHLYR